MKLSDYRRSGLLLALGSMALFLAALGGYFWTTLTVGAMTGPDHIAANDTHVFVHVNGELHVLSTAGAVSAHHSIAPLMRPEQLIDLRVLDGPKLLLARREPAGLYSCDPIAWQCTEINLPVTEKLRAQFKVLPDAAAEQFFISDINGSLWLQTRTGEPQRLATGKQLHVPNDLAWDAAGRLWVADSGNHRFVIFERAPDGAWRKTQILGGNTSLARKGNDSPLTFG